MHKGERIRRQVMGNEFVDRALDAESDFAMPLQSYIIPISINI
ncbi:hypothetical protein [Shewanella waksmanii]|nr:hypothetical protein [Shewanella waksmanii]